MHDMKPVNEQVVVVMGGSSGIGRETALQFAKHGAKVVAAARGEADLRSLEREIRATGGDVGVITADTSRFDDVQAVADEAIAQYGRIDTWAHVAGTSIYAEFEQTTPDEFRRVIDVNLVGPAFGAMAALPYLKRQGGAFIGVSSVEARIALPLQSAYTASKHGLAAMLEALRMELKHDGVPVSVTNIMPASINTPFFEKARTKIGVKPMPVAPVYEPRDVAMAIVYAAQHPREEIIVGGAGKLMSALQRLSPRLVDAIFQRRGYEMQKTDQPKGADAGDSLFAPMAGYGRVEGEFPARKMSYYTWAMTHPKGAAAMATAAAGASAVAASRIAHRGHHNGHKAGVLTRPQP